MVMETTGETTGLETREKYSNYALFEKPLDDR